MKLLSKLNPVQCQAAEHGDGPLLILAGAGSGKTRVLTYRIAHLVQERGVNPYRILAITFTNKAAREMQERLHLLLPQAQQMWIATFHSACLRILKRDIDKLGLQRSFVVYDTADQLTLMKDCLSELNIDDEKYTPQAILGRISMAKNNLQDADAYASQKLDYFESKVSDVYYLYEKKLRRNNALDFDDLLLFTVKLLRESTEVRQHYQERFEHILIDEYQDTNFAQYTIVKILAAQHHNLCVVGDDDQSIYRWRGANLRNILDFEKDYPKATVFKLEQNYRSTRVILNAANGIIANNEGRKDKTLWTENNEGEPITVFTATTEQEEAYYVAHTIGEDLALRGQYSFSDCAVLYRTHAQSRALEEAFMRMGIPYRVIGGFRFYDRKEVKDLLAYLRLIVNVGDDISFKRVVNIPRRGIGDASVKRLEQYAGEQGISLLQASANASQCPGLRSTTVRDLTAFAELITTLARQAEFIELHELVEQALTMSGLLADLQKERTVEAQTRIENVSEMVSVARDFVEKNMDNSLSDFLSSVALVSQGDDEDPSNDRFVSMMSLHSAKGLEFPVVFLVGLEEGVFPHNRALQDPEELEEERRLCYVGITRAREKLFMTHALQRMLYGRYNTNKPSRFLQEVPEELTVTKGGKQEPPRVSSLSSWSLPTLGSVTPQGNPVKPNSGDFGPADKVRHPKFGEGTVVSVNKKGDDTQVTVAFAAPHGIKTLSLLYAPLEKSR